MPSRRDDATPTDVPTPVPMEEAGEVLRPPEEQRWLQACIHYRPLLRSCISPVRVGDLLVVEQELCGYEVGEVAQIENVMARERREVSVRSLDRVTHTTSTTTEEESEESQSVTVDERFSLSAQAEQAQDEQMAISGTVSASYKAPAFSADISTSASYSSSRSSSYATSQEYAKDITEEATKRIRRAVSQTDTVTVVTETTHTELRGFDNTEGPDHVRGIYRWVDKTYRAQLVDYGKRLFLEFVVPEPAFFLRDVGALVDREETASLVAPTHPRDLEEPVRSFKDVHEGNYAELAATYDVTDVEAPPPQTLRRGKAIAHPAEDPGGDDPARQDHGEPTLARAIDSIVVDPGYHLTSFRVDIPQLTVGRPDEAGSRLDIRYGYYTTVGFSNSTGDVNTLLINVLGTTAYYVTHNEGTDNDKNIHVATDRFDEWIDVAEDFRVEGEVPITIGAEYEGKLYFNVMWVAERNDETYDEWRIATYERVLRGYQAKVTEHEQAVREAESQRDTRIRALELRAREETYRSIESHELQKHCIDVLTRHSAFWAFPRRLNQLSTGQMQINLASLLGVDAWQAHNVNGTTAAFFHDAFEWEQMTYALLPYFWADQDRWPELFSEEETGDPQFDTFMKAGAAKVVVPIRPHHERSVLYFLKTNLIWAGGEVPALGDDTHLALLEELHDAVQLEKGDGRPVGEPWDVVVPTSLIYLQPESELPEFDCGGATADDGPAADEGESAPLAPEDLTAELASTVEDLDEEEPLEDEEP